jgi:hypothetical protein
MMNETKPSTFPPAGQGLSDGTEEFLAELTDRAFRVALQQGIVGNLIQFQLDLWSELRSVFAKNAGIAS